MNKRVVGVLLTAVLIVASLPVVYADSVYGNEFYYENEDKTEQLGDYGLGNRFVVNSPSGYVVPEKEPGSKGGIPTDEGYPSGWGGSTSEDIERLRRDYFVFKNNEIVYIEAIYLHNGDYWGVMAPSHIYQPSGWVLMDDLLQIYQRLDFETDNKQSFYPYTGSYDTVLSAKKLVEWEWPGSDREKRVIEVDDRVHNIQSYADVIFAYKDVEGREWGKSTYSGKWICLDDPENDDIPAFYPSRTPVKWSPEGIGDWSSPAAVYPPAEPPVSPPTKPSVSSPAESSMSSNAEPSVSPTDSSPASPPSTEPAVSSTAASLVSPPAESLASPPSTEPAASPIDSFPASPAADMPSPAPGKPLDMPLLIIISSAIVVAAVVLAVILRKFRKRPEQK